MKTPDYVYTVTSIYRRLLDENRAATKEEERRLERAFSRGGFTDGYYIGKAESRSMLGIRTREDKEATREARAEGGERTFLPSRVKISAKCTIKRGEASELVLFSEGGKCARALGAVAEDAISRPLTVDEVKGRVAKMGNTYFDLPLSAIEIRLDEGVNISPKALNELRREAAALLERELIRDGEAVFDRKLIGKVLRITK
jgi:putative protease